MAKSYKVFFCGISKNCIKNIEKNLIFLENYFKSTNLDCHAIFIDSDSTDGTKNILNKYSTNNNSFTYINFDFHDAKSNNRIENILNSRNACLDQIRNKINDENIIYIPLDLDIDLFKFITNNFLDSLIRESINKNTLHGKFPFSIPYYYDIFALRAKKWINYNSQFWVTRLKKNLKIGSFFYNYFLIFRHQVELTKFKQKKLKINSAFGGMGIYNLQNQINNMIYELDEKYPKDISEHVLFNSKFKDLQILASWNIPAPPEHLEFRILNPKQKFKYFFKTIFFDFTKK